MNSRKEICERCWLRQNKGCNSQCQYHSDSTDPIEVSKEFLMSQNDVSIFPFLCMFVIPLYERETGERDTMKKITSAYKKRWKQEHGEDKSEYV